MRGASIEEQKRKTLQEEIELADQLNRDAIGAKIFNATFDMEHQRYDRFTRNLATGKANYGNSGRDWLGIAAIASGTALINTSMAVLAAIGVVAGLASVGVGLGVTLIGIGANIAFTIHRNNVKRERYERAVNFLNQQEMQINISVVKTKIMRRFATHLNHCTGAEAQEFAFKTHKIIANAISNGSVTRVQELVNPQYMEKYAAKLPKPVMQQSAVLAFFHRIKASFLDLWRQRKAAERSQAMQTNTGHGLFEIHRIQDRAKAEQRVQIEVSDEPVARSRI